MQITVGYKIVILLLFSHGCEIWSLILRGENRLRVNEKMVPSKIFVHEMEEVRSVQRKLHTEQIRDISS
jgi:hypothetical protein